MALDLRPYEGFAQVEGFDASQKSAVESYKQDLRSATDRLRRAQAESRAFGDLLSGDVIARGRQVVESIDIRNQTPLFPPLFLTFVENPNWIGATDDALRRIRSALSATPSVYRQFVSSCAGQPMGGLFELNLYRVLDDAFPSAIPQPKIPASTKRSDVLVGIDGIAIYVEGTVLSEGLFWNGVERMMHEKGLSTYATSGPGPADEALRIHSKVAEELKQTAVSSPNVLCISFFGTFPSKLARDEAFNGMMAPAGPGSSPKEGFEHLNRVDSIFEFSRDRLLRVHRNPNTTPECRLTDGTREKLVSALQRPLLIR
jgi:hypothetical protein